jgi:hypothetical protein
MSRDSELGSAMLLALEIGFALWGMILCLALSTAQCITPQDRASSTSRTTALVATLLSIAPHPG